MKTLRTPKQFIDYFSAIPEEQWAERSFYNEKGQSCALGHLGGRSGMGKYPPNCIRLHDLLCKHFGVGPMMINDRAGGPEHIQKLKTPKARILAALREIKLREKP